MFKPKVKVEVTPLSPWQVIFLVSKANGANYKGDELPARKWDWPRETYLQRRLPKAIGQQAGEE